MTLRSRSICSISALWNRAGGNIRRAGLVICPGWMRPVSISAMKP